MNTTTFFLAFAITISTILAAVSSQCFNDNDAEAGPKDANAFADGSSQFALSIFNKVLPSIPASDNIFISPISIWSALTMTYLGTKAESKSQMEKGLSLSATNQKGVNDMYQDLKDGLLHNATKPANYTFNVVNKIYFDEKFQLRNCIIENLNSEVEKLNFVDSPGPSRITINKWVESVTNNKIVDLLPADYITPITVMVLVNAAYFKGYWADQFDEKATEKKDFFLSPGNKVQVPTMSLNQKSFPFLKNSPLGFSAIELPYSGDEASMVILLPNEGTKAEELIPKLTAENVKSLYGSLKHTPVNLELPKFKVEQSMELKENLQAMGITDIFNEAAADMSGFTGKRDSYVAFVRHKTFIEVSEGGTEAAAATAVVSIIRLAAIPPMKPVEEFIVNRPFVLLMRHKKSDIILFAGLIRNPSK